MTTVKLWKVFCIEENKSVLVWNESKPTICPNNHTDRTINTSKTRLIKYMSQDKVTIEEPTNGYFKSLTEKIAISSGTPGNTTTHDLQHPMDVELWKIVIKTQTDNLNDVLSLVLAPEKSIGTLTQNASINDTILTITSNTFTDYDIVKGFEVVLDDGVNKEIVGLITNIDEDNFQITVQNPLTQAFNSGTEVKINKYLIRDFPMLFGNNDYIVGDKGFRSIICEANTINRILYTNNDGQSKYFYVTFEFYYS